MLKKSFILFFVFILFNKVHSQDTTPPDTPLLDSVSVANPATGSVYISWFPCDSADVVGYVIYRQDPINTLWKAIDTVAAPATLYLDVVTNPQVAANFHPELYRIAAIDEVGNISAMTPDNQYHNTIYVFPYKDTTNCIMSVRLEWNKYLNWPEGVSEYKVYFSENYGPWTYLSSVLGGERVYYHQNLNNNSLYCYYIVAISNTGKTSTSNQTCRSVNFPVFPNFINADYASVIYDSRIEVSFTLDTTAIVQKNYKLYRAETLNGTYSEIATFNNYSLLNLVYVDNVDITNNWYYKLAAIDQCGNVVLESNIARNITVNVISGDDITEFISWDSYYNWLGGIQSYNIYRIVDGGAPILAGTTNSDTSFIDDVSDYALNNTGVSGKFCYYIEAVETDFNPHGVKGTSISNIACSNQPSIVYIPNSFTPNGDVLNSEFLPITSFINYEKYQFQIFDRWGKKIFETKNKLKGWNGTINGHKVPSGTYVYRLAYLNSDNELQEKTGLVLLYYP